MLMLLIEKPHAVPRDCSYELLAPVEACPLTWYFLNQIALKWPYDRLAQDIFGNETQSWEKRRHVIRPCQWFENDSRFFFKYRINDHVFFGEQKILVRFWTRKNVQFLDSTRSVVEVGWGKRAMSISLRVSLLSTSASNDLNGPKKNHTSHWFFVGKNVHWSWCLFLKKKKRIVYWKQF